MSKIIIHNNSRLTDNIAVQTVGRVIHNDLISGDRDHYCYHTTFHPGFNGKPLHVSCKKTKSGTYTFYIYIEEE